LNSALISLRLIASLHYICLTHGTSAEPDSSDKPEVIGMMKQLRWMRSGLASLLLVVTTFGVPQIAAAGERRDYGAYSNNRVNQQYYDNDRYGYRDKGYRDRNYNNYRNDRYYSDRYDNRYYGNSYGYRDRSVGRSAAIIGGGAVAGAVVGGIAGGGKGAAIGAAVGGIGGLIIDLAKKDRHHR